MTDSRTFVCECVSDKKCLSHSAEDMEQRASGEGESGAVAREV